MLHPTGDRVLVRAIVPSEQTPSGLWKVEADVEPTAGVVIACGPQVTEVLPGETVVFPRGAGQEVHTPDEPLRLIMAESEISAVLTAAPETCPFCCRPLEA